MDDSRAMDMIAGLMDGEEWDADTLDLIAAIVLETGRTINEPGTYED